MDIKTYPLDPTDERPAYIKDIDFEQGTFDSYPSIMGRIDEYQDRVWGGAYTKTIKERGPEGGDIIRCCWQHNWDEPLGRPLILEEHGRDQLPQMILDLYPDAEGGLFAKTKLTLEVEKAREALALMRDGVVKRMSIGYDPVKFDFEEIEFDSEKQGCHWPEPGQIRNLREIRLYDYSPVTFAAEEAAMIVGVKAVVPYQDLPLASEDRAWDRSAAEGRVRSWAGGGDSLEDMDWGKYRKAFVWYDAENAEQVGAYKLQIGDIIDGRLEAVPRGIFACAVVVQDGRGGVNIPDGDMPKVKTHLAKYYRKMDREPPWEREESALAVAIEEFLSLPDGKKIETTEELIAALRTFGRAEPSSDSRLRTLELHKRHLEALK